MDMFKFHFLISFLAYLKFCTVFGLTGTSCYSTDPNPYRLYGTETAYEDVRRIHAFDSKPTGANLIINLLATGDCIAKYFYLLARHGTSYPTASKLNDVQSLLTRLQKLMSDSATLCQTDINGIKSWTMKLKESDRLALSGRREMHSIENDEGERFRNEFSEILMKPLSESQMFTQHTYTDQTRSSARSFTSAVYNNSDVSLMAGLSREASDRLLKPHKTCHKYIKQSSTLPEVDKFLDGPTMRAVHDNIIHRLGLVSEGLSQANIFTLWDACRFEHAILGPSPWCAVFSHSDLQVLEYASDLKDYWKRGYGNEISANLTCQLVNDIIANLRLASEGHHTGIAALRFADLDILQALYTKLELFKDTRPLRADNMDVNRKWKNSMNSPNSANIAFVLYECLEVPHLRVLVNEVPVQMPGCNNPHFCPMHKVLRTIQTFAKNCDVTKTCAADSGNRVFGTHNINTTVVVSLLLLLVNFTEKMYI